MTRLLNFIVFVAVLLLVSCKSSELPEPDPGKPIGEDTYATFSFNVEKPNSRAINEFDPVNPVENDLDDQRILTSDLRMLIFNATTKAVEYNQPVAPTQTILLTAGPKKIFVFANTANLTDFNIPLVATENFATRVAEFTKGGAKTLTDFTQLTFSAGVPQKLDVVKTNPRTFNIGALHTQVTPGTLGLPMSNSDRVTFTLKAGVSESQASSSLVTSETGDGVASNNKFAIQLDYMVAKARLVTGPDALSDGTNGSAPGTKGTTVIKNVKYAVLNLAKRTKYTQSVVTGSVNSYYHNMYDGTTPQATFDTDFDYSATPSLSAGTTATPGNYTYVPENTNALLRRGQSSYFVIKATFEPRVVTKVEYDVTTILKLTETPLASATPDDKNYIYTREDIEGVPAQSYFKTIELLEEAAWISVKKVAFVENVANRNEAKALVAGKNYSSFQNATSWYRLDLGITDGQGVTAYGVERTNKYTATINKITGPGEPSQENLIRNPEQPVSSNTYIHATIKPAEWKAVNQNGNLN